MEDHSLRDGTKGMNNNTIGSNIKTLKTFLVSLKRNGKVDNDISEFKVFKENPEIIFLTHEELKKLHTYQFEDKSLDFYVIYF